MKNLIASLPLLLLLACASATDIPSQVVDCGPGAPLEIRAGIEPVNAAVERTGDLTFIVEVANNSHEDVTVRSISIQPRRPEDRNRMEGVQRGFDQLVAEGDDHRFRLPINAARLMTVEDDVLRPEPFEFLATVTLTKGDVYRCPFAVERY